MDQFFLKFLGEGGFQVASSYAAFWAYRPSELPGSTGHTLGPANLVKADILFHFLTEKADTVRKLHP